jgi:hypothetical protein
MRRKHRNVGRTLFEASQEGNAPQGEAELISAILHSVAHSHTIIERQVHCFSNQAMHQLQCGPVKAAMLARHL